MMVALGCLWFIPATKISAFWAFLLGVCVISMGLTFLETIANPYITKLGDEEGAARRLNLAQSFNGVGAFIAPLIGGRFILSGVEHSQAELDAMSAQQLSDYLQFEADTIKMPYLVIGLVVVVILLLFAVVRLPEIQEKHASDGKSEFSLRVFRFKQLRWAVAAQLFYIGAQVGVGSFFIRFASYTHGIPEKEAAYMWGSIAMVGFMAGRFFGTFLMKYFRPAVLLIAYAAINVVLLAVAMSTTGAVAVYTLMATPFFMSIMFPTIFALGIDGLGEESKIASSFIVMSIVGGAIFPLFMGQISDANNGNIQMAYIVPVICFLVVAWFGLTQLKKKNIQVSVNH